MKNALRKDIIRDIKKSRGRFLSIMLIVALGVAFFSGIKITPLVMRDTTDKYYDEYNLMDIRVISTLGLTDEDASELKKVEGVDGVFRSNSMDVLAEIDNREDVIKVHGLPDKDSGNNYINKVKVVEGRLPEKQGECVIIKPKYSDISKNVGDHIDIKSGTDDPITDSLKSDKYTVTGIVETPYYLSFELGSTSIGDGSVDGVMMVPQSDFKTEAFSEIYLTVKDAKGKNSYYDEYKNTVKQVENRIEKISGARIDARYNEIVGEATAKLNDAKKEYNDKKNDTEKKLNDAEDEIKKGKQELEDGKAELASKKKSTEKQIKDGFAEIESAQKKLEQAEKELNKAEENLAEKENQANREIEKAQEQLKPLETQISNLNRTISSLEESLKNPNLSDEEKEAIQNNISQSQSRLNELKAQYDTGMAQINQIQESIDSAKEQISTQKAYLKNNKEKLAKEKSNLYTMQKKAKAEFEKAEAEIKSNEQKLKDAESELEESRKKAEDEFKKAEKKIQDAEDEIEKIEKPEWYILNRDKLYSTAEYSGCTDSIDALAAIFPVFFVLVAALVALTTMTRMVDEQRINIGTMKALGYSTWDIAKKYIVYSFSASITGSIIGLMIGYTVFPIIIYNAYALMYTVPEIQLEFNVPIAAASVIVSILVTTLAAFGACYKELMETPSVLMRPKAPKIGKRILLERVPFIWGRISFIGKVTLRNIFRYKKRFMMTVLGISGCTALILTGFGIKDSIQMIVDGQFGELFIYDASVTFDDEESSEKLSELEEYIKSQKDISEYTLFGSQNGKVVLNDEEKSVTIMIPDDNSKMDDFITLRERKGHNPIKLKDNGIVISEKAARNLGASVGDEVELTNENEIKKKVKITGITENYTNHYVYMSKESYKNIYGRDPEINTALLNMKKELSSDDEGVFSEKIINSTCAEAVSFNTGIRDSFSDTIKSLNYVVLLMIISAGALAFVVLYNLSNVNISERIREIATIKVLGFYDREVSQYIYRENVILTIIGTILGLFIGTILHQFIMVTVEVENMMFGRIINPISYVIAAVLTIILGIIVNFAMNRKLKNIKMVESLKSVD